MASESKTPKKTETSVEKTPKTAASKAAAPKAVASKAAPSKTATSKATAPKTIESKVPSKAPSKTTSNIGTKPTSTKPSASSTAGTKSSAIKPVAPSAPMQASSAKPSPVKSSANSAKAPISANKDSKPKVKEIKKEDLNKNLLAEDNVEDKKKKKKVLLILLFLLLGIAIIGVIVFVILTLPKNEIKFNVIIESDIVVSIENENGQIEEIKYLPGDVIDGEMQITIQNVINPASTSESVYLRFKIEVEIEDNIYSGMFDPIFKKTDDWYETSSDGYYYYKGGRGEDVGKCFDNDVLDVFDGLDFISSRYTNKLNGKSGTLIFTVEILESNKAAIGQTWHTAPDEWREIVK